MEEKLTVEEIQRRFAQEVKNYTRPLPRKLRELLPFEEAIKELRQKGASYEVIARLLSKYDLKVKPSAVYRFCHEVLQSPRNVGAGNQTPPAPASDSAVPRQNPQQEAASKLVPMHGSENTQPPSKGAQSSHRGPRIANTKDL